jgi:copper chaperone NosL
MKKLSIISRIILAVASLCIIAAYFFPVWRIDLFAPQYPEGLVMKIWLNKLTGDVEIINGLNHYIGMKKISVEMFPELNYPRICGSGIYSFWFKPLLLPEVLNYFSVIL